MKSNLLVAFSMAVLAVTTPVMAGPQKLPTVGQMAPALSVDSWLKGTKINGFESGTVYVVEFWGTWCGPCIKNFPHLSALQKKHQDDGLVVIGVATHEWKGLEAVTKFMKKRGSEMGYHVAYDDDFSMEHDWQTLGDSTVQFKMPEVFLVDATGKIAWIGHPDQKDEFHSAIEKELENAKKP
jgi:thiol-disulfide isomerase/thioredoxin